MTEPEIRSIVEKQRAYFDGGATLSVQNRIQALNNMRVWIEKNGDAICAALRADLGKSAFESFMCEAGMVLSEIRFLLRNIRRLSAPKKVRTPLAQFPSRSFVLSVPKGVVLIMSPWNYPFMLTAEPLADALAAGNCAVVKPSAYSPASSALLERMIAECFPPEFVAMVKGGRAENTALLKEKFDHIFFTGSQTVGKDVMRAAAEYLTPVTLELGGKSPCVVCKDADLRLAARRIVFGKFLNCGQTCVAPDFVYCDESVRDSLLEELRRQIAVQFGAHPLENPDYGKIISRKHFDRILPLIEADRIFTGGEKDEESLRIAPTVLSGVDFSSPSMQEEIFGPVLPVLAFRTENEALSVLARLPHPLAFYVFTRRKKTARHFLTACRFGGGCINDTVIHLATSRMGFGGFGESGMGSYHGEEGFRTFSHQKSIVDKKLWFDLPVRYQPYTPLKENLLRMFLR